MNSHFCKVGKITQNLNKRSKLEYLEHQYSNFIEEAYNVKQTDMSLSDILFYEAQQLKRKILNLKNISLEI
jgi:hypothetical protein